MLVMGRRKPKERPPRRGRGSLSREEILGAALAVLQSEGPEHLTMRRIARELGCSVASPYAHFESQEEIIRTLIARGEKRLTDELIAARAGSSDVFEQLTAIAHTYWRFARDHRELHRMMFGVTAGTTYRRVFPSLPTSYRVFLDTIRRGIQTGAIRHPSANYRAIAGMMWAWMYGLIVLDMTDMLRAGTRDPIAEGVRLFQEMLRGPEQVRAEHRTERGGHP